MAITYVGGAGVNDSSNTQITPPIPAGHAADDFAVALVRRDAAGNTAGAWSTAAAGWTLLEEVLYADDRAMRVGVFYKLLTSASEPNPQFDTNASSDQLGCVLGVWRGVDAATPFDVTYALASHRLLEINNRNPVNQPITTVTAGAEVVLLHAATQNDQTAGGAPATYTLRESVAGQANRNCFLASLVVSPAGVETPGAWTHSGSLNNSDNVCYTLALRPLPPVGGTTLEQEGFRFDEDDATEGAATPIASQDTNITRAQLDPFRLRALVNATGNPASGSFKLQARQDGGAWSDIATGAVGDITVNAAVRHQIIHGWEATAQLGEEHVDFNTWKVEAVRMAVEDVGINAIRIGLHAGMENTTDWYAIWAGQGYPGPLDGDGSEYQTWRDNRNVTVNDNADPLVTNAAGFQWTRLDKMIDEVYIPMRTKLAAQGETCWLTVSGVAGDLASYVHDDPDELAEFYLAVFDHLKNDKGVDVDLLDLINEPNNSPNWSSDGTKFGLRFLEVKARLAAAGYTPLMAAPSGAFIWFTETYLDDFLAVAGVPAALDMLTWHEYDHPTTAQIAALAARAPTGALTGMLEKINWGSANLYSDLTAGNVSIWEQFALAFFGTPPGNANGAYIIIDEANSYALSLASKAPRLSQYFRYVRSGATRVGATSTKSGVDATAYEDTSLGLTVVYEVTAGAGPVTIAGLPGGNYDITYTDATVHHASAGTVAVSGGLLQSPAMTLASTVTVTPS